MVKDNFNYYYTQVLKELQEEYSGLAGSSESVIAPPSFPFMYFHQIGGEGIATTLSNTEDAINLGIQLEIYSDKSVYEARKISNSAREILIGMGFSCNYFEPLENADDFSLYRFIGRYEIVET